MKKSKSMYGKVCFLMLILALALAGCGSEDTTAPRGLAGESGDTGPAGPAGPSGDTGPAGPAGQAGNTGPAGQNGEVGADWPGRAPAAYTAADGIAGGAAYSQWYAADGGGTGTLAGYGVTVAADFVRCKACHAWDGLGNAGSYANRTGMSSGAATRPDVSSVNLRNTVASSTYQELYDLIALPAGRTLNATGSGHPDLSAALTSTQTWNIVKFLREEFVNQNDLYDFSISGAAMHYEWDGSAWVLVKPVITYTNIGKGGSAENGEAVYTAKCSGCHGTDGKTTATNIGKAVRTKPYEVWFKAKFGEPGKMNPGIVTSTQDLKDLYSALTNTVKFPD